MRPEPTEGEDPLAAPAADRGQLELARRWFLSYGFTSTLHIGLDLLDHGHDFSPTELAELHHLVALSAHNRQFHSTQDKRIERFLYEHFSRAFALETDPRYRTALCYRLAVVCGRRLGNIEEAAEWAERGIAMASELKPLDAAYQMAWCRNIRSYLRVRRHEIEDALNDTEESYRILGPFVHPLEKQPEKALTIRDLDVLATGHLLADHAVMLSVRHGDVRRGAFWMERVQELYSTLPAVEYLDYKIFLAFYRKAGEPRAALARSLQSRRQAAQNLDYLREFELTVEAALFAACLGDAPLSVELLRAAHELSQQLGPDTGLLPLAGPLAAVLVRAGKAEEAEALLTDALANLAFSGADAQADLLALSSVCALAIGNARQAQERIEAAIDAAVESGREITLARIAIAAGDVALELGDLGTAREAFARTAQLLEESFTATDASYPAEWARLAAGLWRAGVREPEILYPWAAAALGRAELALKNPAIWELLVPWSEAIHACGLDDDAGGSDLTVGRRALEKALAERLAYRGELLTELSMGKSMGLMGMVGMVQAAAKKALETRAGG